MIIKKLSFATVTAILILGCTATRTTQVEANPPSVDTDIKTAQTLQTESIDSNTKVKASKKKRSGSFSSGEYPTNGGASIVQENGNYFIEFDQNFKTSDRGPDLFIILHQSPNVLSISNPPDFPLTEGQYIVIAPLQSYSGKQRYAIPKNIQVDSYQSVAVWCRRYNATFGSAPLS